MGDREGSGGGREKGKGEEGLQEREGKKEGRPQEEEEEPRAGRGGGHREGPVVKVLSVR